MVSLKDIKGQDNVIRYLSNSLSSGRTSSSYLFTGPEGVGRTLVARAFVNALMCSDKPDDTTSCGRCPTCMRIASGDHPDIVWIKPEKNRSVKIDQVRGVKETLSLKPYESKMNVCVIEDAHLMTRDASNALLKVLEEPPGHSVIILVTNKKELLLETVISRCAEVRFRSLSVEDTRDSIMRQNGDLDEERYQGYLKMQKEIKFLERRKTMRNYLQQKRKSKRELAEKNRKMRKNKDW